MDKEKEIEEMKNDIIDNAVLDDISENYGDDIFFVECHTVAKRLYELGYGNIKQAVKEFMDNKVKPLIDELVEISFDVF